MCPSTPTSCKTRGRPRRGSSRSTAFMLSTRASSKTQRPSPRLRRERRSASWASSPSRTSPSRPPATPREAWSTARMEEELDRIGEGGKYWLEYIRQYYTLLSADLAKAGQSEGVKGKGIPIEENCPACGKPLVIRDGRFGRFKACSGFPACTFKESLRKAETRNLDEPCPTCGAQLVEKRGRYGFFVACSTYPNG